MVAVIHCGSSCDFFFVTGKQVSHILSLYLHSRIDSEVIVMKSCPGFLYPEFCTGGHFCCLPGAPAIEVQKPSLLLTPLCFSSGWKYFVL